jgi:hypothetical protein
MLPKHLKGSRSELGSRTWIVAGFALLLILSVIFAFAGDMLIASDSLPGRVDGFVVLQGSVTGENARLAGAVELVQQRFSGSRILLSVPHETYWGQWVEPLAHAFVERKYGEQVTERIDFCETGPDVNSTEQEAGALISCIEKRELRDVVVVTSNYHTRRAGIIWRNELRKRRSSLHLWIYGVNDPEFQATKWWQTRVSAKTTFFEFTKLASVLLSRWRR